MTHAPRARLPAPPAASLLVAAALVAVVGCGMTAPTVSPAASPGGGPTAPGGPTASPGATDGATDGPPTQTDTEWGRIWDAVPAAFPRYPGSLRDEPNEPASAWYVTAGAPDEVATWLQAALERAGYSTEAMSGPFEDGGIVIDSIGPTPDCRVQTRVAPVGATTRISVLYGASCPFE